MQARLVGGQRHAELLSRFARRVTVAFAHLKNLFVEVVEALVAAQEGGRRPVIFALSNPKSQAEITAADAYVWSEGKVIYGYTWNVRKLNEGAGDYRITFYLDDACPAGLNTFFADVEGNPVTQLMVPIEEAAMTTEGDDGGDTGGATGVIEHADNLTYIDVRILERGGGGGGGPRK